jgi:hypothetical protein
MITSPSDHRQVVPIRESGTILRLVEHCGSRPDSAAPPARAARTARRDERIDAAPLRPPTTAECYGCVDWFQF